MFELWDMTDGYGQDKSGSLDPSEFRAAVAGMGLSLSEEECGLLFNRADRARDGRIHLQVIT